MIFRNPYDIEKADFKASYFKSEVTLKKAKSLFERIFNLDEKDEED